MYVNFSVIAVYKMFSIHSSCVVIITDDYDESIIKCQRNLKPDVTGAACSADLPPALASIVTMTASEYGGPGAKAMYAQ